jgi:hypothetical protein
MTRLPSTKVPLVDRSRTTTPASVSSTEAWRRDTSSCLSTTVASEPRPITMSGPDSALMVRVPSADAISTSTAVT